MDIRSAIGSIRADGEPRTVARESAPPASPSAASSPAPPSEAGRNAAPETVRTTASGQFYVSPFLTFDSRSLTVIFQVRDTESGDVERQFPAEAVVERYRRDPSARPFVLPEPDAGGDQQPGPPPPTIGGPVTQAIRDGEAASPEVSGTQISGGTAPDSRAPVGAAGPDSAPAQTPASPPPPAGRSTIDLVA